MNATAPSRPLSRPTSTVAVASAALGAAGVCLAFAGVQIALAAGAPLGEHVWGGTQDRVLPTGMRITAVGAAIILMTMASVVVRRAGLIGRPARWLGPAIWAVAGVLAINTIGNLASTSAVERLVVGPATAAAAGLTAMVAHLGRGAVRTSPEPVENTLEADSRSDQPGRAARRSRSCLSS